MADKNKNIGWIALIAIVLIGYLLIAGNPFATKDDNGMVPIPVGVTCNKDYTADVTLMSRNAFEKASIVTTADTMLYKVWKLVGTTQIPQSDLAEAGSLTVGYNEKYLVVAMTNATLGDADVRFLSKTFEVDAECNSPKADIFYLESLPSDITYRFEGSDLFGFNANDNRFEVEAEATISLEGRFTGKARTVSEAIIVFDVVRTQFSKIDSSLATAALPNSHTAGAGERSYAFELGRFDGSKPVLANFDIDAHMNALTGNENVTFTIYQYQTGYENTRTGDWVSTKSIEDNDDNVLLPEITGTLYVEII